MKKRIGTFITAVIVFLMVLMPTTPVKAAGLSLSGVPGTVNIGDTFTITITTPENIWSRINISYNKSLLSYVSASGAELDNAGTYFYDFSSSASTVTVTLKAIAEGSDTISVSAVDAETADGAATTISGASKTVKIANATSDNNPPVVLSGDNSLASLVLSQGTLSPALSYGKTSYTATVDYNVTNLEITARPSHAKAIVQSVTGNKNLVVGKNTIKVVVKAENGTTATYTIVVTRKEKPATSPEGGTDTPPQDTQQEQPAATFEVNGQNLKVATEIPPEVIPVDFSLSSVLLDNVDYPSLAFNNGDLMLLYLTNEDGTNGALYVYDNTQNAIYTFVKLLSEKGYIIVLLPAIDIVPENYEENTLSIEGKGFVYAYRAEQMTSDFYHLYGMNSQGESGWYQYDTKEGTYQRFVQSEQEEEVVPQESEDSNDELKELEQWNRLMMIIFIVVIAVLVVIIVVLIVTKGRKKNIDDDDDFLDELDIIETESTEPIEQSDDELEE